MAIVGCGVCQGFGGNGLEQRYSFLINEILLLTRRVSGDGVCLDDVGRPGDLAVAGLHVALFVDERYPQRVVVITTSIEGCSVTAAHTRPQRSPCVV